MTFAEYIELEASSEIRSEFYGGEIFAMSGGKLNHALIGTNLTRELGNRLMENDCFVVGSDLKVRIEAADAGVYPDGMVICGDAEHFEDRQDIVTNPQVVIEVLSESTAAWDRGGKFKTYGSLPSLQEYVVVEQQEPTVEVFRRIPEGAWLMDRYEGMETAVELKSLGISVPMARIYHKVDFPEETSSGPAKS